VATYHRVFEIETEYGPSFHNVTDEVRETIRLSEIKNGIAVVYSQHTTCSIIIQEDSLDTTLNGTPFVFQDLLDVFQAFVPTCRREGQYMHPGPKCIEYSVNEVDEKPEWTLNTDAHLRSSLIGKSEAIPLVEGELELGRHGRIYFADFDGTRTRKRNVQVQVVGDR
jgi:secondary thiamine-phosphate synthase enzyme